MAKNTSLRSLEIDPVAVGGRGGPPPQYVDLDKLKNADGIIAIISQRLSNRAITFAVFKEFERDKRLERTSFIAASLRDSYLNMVQLVLERIDALQRDAKLMKDLQVAAIGTLPKEDQDHAKRILFEGSKR